MNRINVILLCFSLFAITMTFQSCGGDDACPAINCNSGTLNEATCSCTCPAGFSGTNCQTEDKCVTENIECQNGGTCVNGACDCPDGYIGTSCENLDLSNLQALLDAGRTPKDLFDAGATLEQLYGKMYQGGLIFYLNTTDGTGMVASTADEDEDDDGIRWGCTSTDISNLDNVSNFSGTPSDEPGARLGEGQANTDAILADCTSSGAAKLCRDKGHEWFLPSLKELELIYTNLHLNGHGGLALDSFNSGWYYSSTENDGDFAWYLDFGNGDDSVNFKDTKCHVRAAKAF